MMDDKSEYSFVQTQLQNVSNELIREQRRFLQEQILKWGDPSDLEIKRLVTVLNMVPPGQVPAGWDWVNKVLESARVISKLWQFQQSLGDKTNPPGPVEEPQEDYKEVNEENKED